MCRVSENTTSSIVIGVPSQNFTPGRTWNTYFRLGLSYFQLVASSGTRVSLSDTPSSPSIPHTATHCELDSKAVAMSRPTIVEVFSAHCTLGMSASEVLPGAEDVLPPGELLDPPDPPELPHAASRPGTASAAPPSPRPRSS